MRRPPTSLALVLLFAGCVTFTTLTPARVESVPPGEYRVHVVEDTSGSHGYYAVLFVRAPASVTLDTPTVDRGMTASPGDYQVSMRTGYVVYELKSRGGPAQGYLMVSSHATVRVWEQAGSQGPLHVLLRDVSGEPEMGGGGGGAGGGAM
ncbi:MAG TPA: hypothetical protein VMI34_15470 [Candidatus Bathyarchaeia archaeon]|nr:hypothetical protein [Candidatus Bathyarchaeia archaeon]